MQKIFAVTLLLALASVFVWSSVSAVQECETYCTQVNAEVQRAQQEKRDPVLPAQPAGFSCICNPLQAKTFTDLINNIMNFLFGVSIVVIPIMVVFAGFMFLTAGGNPAQFTKARGLLLWTAVGFGVILLAKGLTTVLRQIIGF
ncbi:MAG: pilin [Candidatus Wildermuthbacteria bacterium]|nr:pilin [Candidatus Wildermuthbacteria bacterium]